MAFTIDAGSADIKLVVDRAKADTTAGERSVFFHLTNGFDLATVEGLGAEPRPAFSADGRVKVALGGANALANAKFGFVQLAKMHFGQAFYAGRISREGSIAVMFQNAMPAKLLLDSLDDRTPFTRQAPQFQLFGNEIRCETSDHPALKVPRELRNSGRNVKNFLFHVIDNREFWSVLTAIEPGGKRHFLHHFHWQVSYNVVFNWVGGKPTPASNRSRFTLHGKAKGGPTDADLQGLLTSPVGPQFNVAAAEAMLKAFLGARGPNRTENDRWFNNVPVTFFT